MSDDTKHVVDRVREWLARFIVTAHPGDLDLLTLWAVHTHLTRETFTTPRLVLDSPLPGSGKTTTLDHLQRLCFQPVQAANVSSAALLPRLTEKSPRTILIDEADRNLSPKNDKAAELIAIINSGYRHGASRPVLVQKDREWITREMSTFAPVAIAGNSPDLADDTRQRCLTVLLLPDAEDHAEESEWQDNDRPARVLGEALASWAETVRDRVAALRPHYPDGLKGRPRELWGPLLKVALVAGGEWPDRCRSLIDGHLEQAAQDREDGFSAIPRHVQLLRDIHDVWPDGEMFVASMDLLQELHAGWPHKWGTDSQYGPLTLQAMGRLLAHRFGIRASRETVPPRRRGYRLATFTKSWAATGVP